MIIEKVLDVGDTNKLITQTSYQVNNISNTFENQIRNEVKEIETLYGNADSATKLAKAIDTIYPSQQQIDNNKSKGMTLENTWNEAKRTFNLYSSGKKIEAADNNPRAIQSEIEGHINKLYKYYEYIQFKKATFKCNNVEYDNATGRVKKMVFYFVSIS